MITLDTTKLNILRKLIGFSGIRLLTVNINIMWGRNALVPSISIPYTNGWIIINSIITGVCDNDLEIAYIDIHEADSPLDAEYVRIDGGHKILSRYLSEIRFVHPSQIESIEIYRFTETHRTKNCLVDYDGAIVFTFLDQRKFFISAFETVTGLLSISTEVAEMNRFIIESKNKIVLTQ